MPSLTVLGAGSAAVVVATYTSCLKVTVALSMVNTGHLVTMQATLSIPGYTESVETYSLGTVTTCLLSPFVDSFLCSVSGLHNAAYSLGNFTGPTLAGLIYQKVIKDTIPYLRGETMFPRLGSVGAVWSSRS